MKKLVTLVIAIALVLSLGTLAAAEGPVKAYAVTVMSGGAAWGRFEAGFLEACEELGWEGHYLAPSTANDYTAMVQLTETALNDGADVLAVCVSDTGLFQEVLQRAKDAGVTLIGAAAGLEGYTSALVGTDAAQLGANTADTLVKLMGDKPIHVAVRRSSPTRCRTFRFSPSLIVWLKFARMRLLLIDLRTIPSLPRRPISSPRSTLRIPN